MSTITLAELQTWLHRENTPQRYRDGLTVLSGEFHLLPVDEYVANRFGSCWIEVNLLQRLTC